MAIIQETRRRILDIETRNNTGQNEEPVTNSSMVFETLGWTSVQIDCARRAAIESGYVVNYSGSSLKLSGPENGMQFFIRMSLLIKKSIL